MKKTEFKYLVDEIVRVYGVNSYLDNRDFIYDDDDVEEDDLWFECPECGEPITFEDYKDELEVDYNGTTTFCCPVCGVPLEIEDDED